MKRPKIIFLVGPTASGKTEAAVYLARRIKAEIISCDSMQIYKGMDIITSKPALSLKKRVRHHLIDIIATDRTYNVFRYFKEASSKAREILARNKTPLFVGGTGLYMSVLLDGIFKVKAEDAAIRRRLYKQAEDSGSAYLYAQLKKIDPQAALKIHSHDTRRIVRALEVFKVTGELISKLQSQRKGLWDIYDVSIFCLDIQAHRLYQRINARVEAMFKEGLVAEVKKLSKLRLSKTARYAIGIRELKGYFDGEYSLDHAKELIKRNTRLYAKRQLTWFRKDKRIIWVKVRKQDRPQEIAKKIWGTQP